MTAPDLTEPAHIEMPPILRRAANRMRLGPQRDAVLCLADELEVKRDVSLISHSTLRDAMYAYGDEDAFIDEDDCANDMSARRPAGAGLDSRIMAEPDADEPAHIRMPPILRRAAARRPPGPPHRTPYSATPRNWRKGATPRSSPAPHFGPPWRRSEPSTKTISERSPAGRTRTRCAPTTPFNAGETTSTGTSTHPREPGELLSSLQGQLTPPDQQETGDELLEKL